MYLEDFFVNRSYYGKKVIFFIKMTIMIMMRKVTIMKRRIWEESEISRRVEGAAMIDR